MKMLKLLDEFYKFAGRGSILELMRGYRKFYPVGNYPYEDDIKSFVWEYIGDVGGAGKSLKLNTALLNIGEKLDRAIAEKKNFIIVDIVIGSHSFDKYGVKIFWEINEEGGEDEKQDIIEIYSVPVKKK